MQADWIRKAKEQDRQIEEVRHGDVPFLEFPLLRETKMVVHGFTTREGGVSEGIFSSMNLSFTRGDDPARVKENYRRAAAALGVPAEHIVCSDQTHTTNVRHVTMDDRGKGVFREKDYRDVDGLITDTPGLVLATFFADCVPLFFVDPVRRCIGLSHSGWKGTAARMGARTVEAMTETFGSDPADIRAAIGPSICVDCYEVSEDVIQAFAKNYDQAVMKEICYRKENGKYQLNLWEANRHVLLAAGILPEHLAVTDICTCCNPNRLFSHRASQGKRGNLAAFLAISDGI